MGAMRKNGRLVYGGCFNPLHMGHLRLALECMDKMASLANRLEFLPAASPPHKKIADILPFELRATMIRSVIRNMPSFFCNEMEKDCPGPSYTYKILQKLGNQQKEEQIFFIVGSQDFALLPTWWRGLDLPHICSLVVVPRGGQTAADFMALGKQFWPDALAEEQKFNDSCTGESGLVLKIRDKHSVFWLEVPQLDISASRIRKLWLCGRNVNFLTPEPVTDILNREEKIVRMCWEGE